MSSSSLEPEGSGSQAEVKGENLWPLLYGHMKTFPMSEIKKPCKLNVKPSDTVFPSPCIGQIILLEEELLFHKEAF